MSAAEIKQTTLCYLERDGKYLMLHRTKKKNDASHDKWIAVGGKFETNESPEDCMLREVKEETGFTVTNYRYAGVVTFLSDEWPSEMMHLFVCTDWSGVQKECDEGELEWIDIEDVAKLPMWEGDRIFLKLLKYQIPFFSLKLTYAGETLTSAILNGKPYNEKENPCNLYRHFKGGLYRYVGVANDSETLEESVVYQALYGEKKLWVRPREMFFENVTRDGETFTRFKEEQDY